LENVKQHFEQEAEEFDKTILMLIPLYTKMINSMISSIPYDISDEFKVLDLGCGTGNVTKAIKEKFNNARVSCIDIAENMIQMAKMKLANYEDINYYTGDFSDFDFEEKYDVIVSSLALHHIKSDNDKKQFYRRIYEALKEGGILLNSDVVLGSNENLQNLYTKKWVEFMLNNIPRKEIEEKWLPKSVDEDFPATITNHIKWLNETGFKSIDVIWKCYGLAVYCGTRQ
jgi:tRNA (cmo5U34)-methyltransferase